MPCRSSWSFTTHSPESGFEGDAIAICRIYAEQRLRAVGEYLEETRFVFDVELTLLLVKSGFKIREVPINCQEVPGSKVSILKNSIRMFSEILRIKKRHGTASERQ
jgi:hypothetical protein